MAGIWKQTQEFLTALKGNNTKAWFDEHRVEYETFWRAPALNLIEELSTQMSALDPVLKAEARINGSLRRINRDVRFSKDKSPYDPRLHLVFWAGGHPNRSPAMHVVIQPDGWGYGAGVFGLEPSALTNMRQRICDPATRADLHEAIQCAQDVGCTFGEPELKKLPKGFQADGDWEHLLRRKGMVLRTHDRVDGPNWANTQEAAQDVMRLTQACLPLIRWLTP